MTGNESRPDSGDAGAACPPAGWREPAWFTDLAGTRSDRDPGPNPSAPAAGLGRATIPAVGFGGMVHTRAGRRPDPGADMTQANNAVRNAYATPLTTPQTPGPIRPASRETAKPTPAQQLPRQQPETSRPPPVRTNREHSSCFVLESRGAVGQFGKAGAMISGSRKTQCGSPSALTCPCGPHDRL